MDPETRKYLEDIRNGIEDLRHTIHGNGRPGLKTEVALLLAWKQSVGKLTWIIVGSAGTAIGGAVASVVINLI